MGANPVWVSIHPRKEGECFSLPSETKKIDALYQQVWAFVKKAQQQGQAILYVPTSTTLDLEVLKTT